MEGNDTLINDNYTSVFGNVTSMHGTNTWIHDNVTLIYWNDTKNHGNDTRINGNNLWIHGTDKWTYGNDTWAPGNETSVYGNDTLINGNNTWKYENVTVLGENIITNVLIYGIVIPVLNVIGVAINLLCVLAINMEKKKTSNDIVILSWTLADLFSFIGSSVMNIKGLILIVFPDLKISHGDILLSELWLAFCYRYPVSISKVIVAMLAVERFTAIKFPLKLRIIWTERFTTIASISTFIFPTVLYACLRILIGSVVDVVYTLTITISSITVTAVFNILSVHGIMENNKAVIGLIESQKQKRLESEKKWNKVLIGASVLTIVCYLPALTQNIFIVVFKASWDTDRYTLFWGILNVLNLMFHMILSCSNCLILVLNNNKYMASVSKIIRCKRGESG